MLFFNLFIFTNYINSRFKKYEPARFRLVGKPSRNQFRLPPTLAGKSPNPTGTLTLFLGLCPTLAVTSRATVRRDHNWASLHPRLCRVCVVSVASPVVRSARASLPSIAVSFSLLSPRCNEHRGSSRNPFASLTYLFSASWLA